MLTDWVQPTYTWRGKTYKTITGLCRAVDKGYGSAAVSFGPLEMHVRLKSGVTYVFDIARNGAVNEVCDQPKAGG